MWKLTLLGILSVVIAESEIVGYQDGPGVDVDMTSVIIRQFMRNFMNNLNPYGSCLPGTEPGLYANTASGCRQYYKCDTDNKRTNFECPTTTLFNQITQQCDTPTAVKCGWTNVFSSLPRPATNTQISPSNAVDPDDSSPDTEDTHRVKRRAKKTAPVADPVDEDTNPRSSSNTGDTGNNRQTGPTARQTGPTSRQTDGAIQGQGNNFRVRGDAKKGGRNTQTEQRVASGVGNKPAWTFDPEMEAGLNGEEFGDWSDDW